MVTLMNSRAFSNFILSYTIIRLYIKTELREELYGLSTIDRKLINTVNGLIYVKTEEITMIYYMTKH